MSNSESRRRGWRTSVSVAGCLLALAACANTAYTLTGRIRPAIDPEQVTVYSQLPPRYEEVAILDAASHSAFNPGGKRAMDKVIGRLKDQAAELGANGIVLEGFSDRETESLGTGVGTGATSGTVSTTVGINGSLGVFTKTGRARAIWTPPGVAPVAAPIAPPPPPTAPQ